MDLSVEHLTVRFGAREALSDVSASFAPGRVTVLLGPNGAGKSTLLRTLAGLIPATQGEARLGDQRLQDTPPRRRAQDIGYLPQDAVVHWNMRARDLVALGRLPHRDGGGEAINAALAATDTVALADRPVRALSGGERARVLLARVLAGEPRWLLADEPLASLDPLHQLETLALLRRAAEGGMGVVAVLHDLTQAARVADNVLLLSGGRRLAFGPARDVLTANRLAAAYGVEVAILEDGGGRPVIAPTGRLNI